MSVLVLNACIVASSAYSTCKKATDESGLMKQPISLSVELPSTTFALWKDERHRRDAILGGGCFECLPGPVCSDRFAQTLQTGQNVGSHAFLNPLCGYHHLVFMCVILSTSSCTDCQLQEPYRRS